VYLVPQMADIYVDNVGCAIEALVPNVLDDHGARENTPRIRHQVFQKAIFLTRQLNPFPATSDLLGQPVKFNVSNPQHGLLPSRASAQQSLDSDQQFGKRKRLGQVIVCACFEMGGFVANRIAGRQDKDWNLAIGPANLAEYLGSIQARQ